MFFVKLGDKISDQRLRSVSCLRSKRPLPAMWPEERKLQTSQSQFHRLVNLPLLSQAHNHAVISSLIKKETYVMYQSQRVAYEPSSPVAIYVFWGDDWGLGWGENNLWAQLFEDWLALIRGWILIRFFFLYSRTFSQIIFSIPFIIGIQRPGSDAELFMSRT